MAVTQDQIMATKSYGEQTIVDRVKFWGETEPDTPAFIFWGVESRYVLSRGDVLDLSSRFAYRLTQRGIHPGDVICISLPNCPERVVVEFGVQLAGAVSMNGQVLRDDGQDFVESMNKAYCKMVILDKHQENQIWRVLEHHFKILSVEGESISVESDTICSMGRIEQCTVNRKTNIFLKSLKSEIPYIYCYTKPSNIASIFTTSGSSGPPKLVKHSHRSLLRSGVQFNRCTKLSAPQKLYKSFPLGWLGGYPAHYLYSGCPRVLLDVSAQDIANLPLFITKVVSEEDVRTAVFHPVHVNMLHELTKNTRLKRRILKKIITGGQPIKRENLSSIGLLTESFQICYGETEVGYIATMSIEERDVQQYEDCTVGYALPGVQIKIEADNNYKTVANRGEILIKSETISLGYIHDQGSSAAFLEDGWFRTGDVGYLKEDGCLVVEGRANDVIKHGAYILYPVWLEQKLFDCPGVKQVVIVPVPDPTLHHEICACILPDEGYHLSEEDIISFCRQQIVVDSACPMNIVPRYVIFFDKFPLTGTSKLDRKTLTNMARSKLKL